MNQLNAVITAIITEDNISQVFVEAAGITFSTLVIDTPATAAYPQEGNEVAIIFKETAVAVAKNISGGLSICNRFPATITAVKSGKVLTAVSLQCNGVSLTAVITTQSADNLAIAAGDEVEGLVKTNDISLLQKDHG